MPDSGTPDRRKKRKSRDPRCELHPGLNIVNEQLPMAIEHFVFLSLSPAKYGCCRLTRLRPVMPLTFYTHNCPGKDLYPWVGQ